MPVNSFRWSQIWTRDPCERYRDFFYNREYISFRQEPDGSFVNILCSTCIEQKNKFELICLNSVGTLSKATVVN